MVASAAPLLEVRALDAASARAVRNVALPPDTAEARLRAFDDPAPALARGRVTIDTVEWVTTPPHVVGRETRSARYVAGELEVSNPAKHDCQMDVLDRQASLADDQAHYDELHDAYQACVNAASQAGGWGGALAATGCATGYVALGVTIANERQALNSAEGKCDETPYTLTESREAEMSYQAETWATDCKGRLRVRLLDAADGAELFAVEVEDRVEARDTAVFGQPEFNVSEDPLELSSSAAMEAELLKRLEPKLADTLRAVAIEAWRLGRARVTQAPSPSDRLDAAGLLVVLDERRAESVPELATLADALRAEAADGAFAVPAIGPTALPASAPPPLRR